MEQFNFIAVEQVTETSIHSGGSPYQTYLLGFSADGKVYRFDKTAHTWQRFDNGPKD